MATKTVTKAHRSEADQKQQHHPDRDRDRRHPRSLACSWENTVCEHFHLAEDPRDTCRKGAGILCQRNSLIISRGLLSSLMSSLFYSQPPSLLQKFMTTSERILPMEKASRQVQQSWCLPVLTCRLLPAQRFSLCNIKSVHVNNLLGEDRRNMLQ